MKKKIYSLVLVAVFILLLGIGLWTNMKDSKKQFQNLQATTPTVSNLSIPSVSPLSASKETATPTTAPAALPSSYKIANFPFQSQAPLNNWDELHDEACEEASIIIVKYYLDGKSLSAEEMEQEIQILVAWQEKNWGGHYDLTAEETADLAKKVYGINFDVKSINSISDIKAEISQGHPVIVPTAGRLLGNPYYRQPGPVYHMLVVIGYENSTIITQDVGTRRGDHYQYSEKVLYNALHDWNGSPENIESGPKNILIFN